MNSKTAILEEKVRTSDLPKSEGRHFQALFVVQLLIAMAAAILVLEGYFKLAGVGGQEFLQPDREMGCRHIANKQVIWHMEGYSKDKINSVGLRDSEHNIKKEAGTYRIILLGDSAVESLQVAMSEVFGKVLEKLLNTEIEKAGGTWQNKGQIIRHFEVLNFGCSSYSTGQEFLQYVREAEKYEPDTVVLLYNRGDSLENIVNDKDRKRAEVRPYFYLDEKGNLKQDNSILDASADKLKSDPLKDFLRRNSSIYGVLTQADLSLSLNEQRYRKLKNWWQALLNLPNKLAGRKTTVQHSAYPNQDDLTVTKALLCALNEEIKAKQGQFILAVFPNILKYEELKKQAKELKILADKNKFEYLDLSKSFLACKDPSGNFLQYHFSQKGHSLVAYDLLVLLRQNLTGSSTRSRLLGAE